jgi:hypothetical protein
MPGEKNHSPAIRRLAQALTDAHNEQDCNTCLDMLEAYVDAQLSGAAYTELFPQVALHLDSCVACAESYALLYAARLAEDQLPAPARLPAPDLSFLKSHATSHPSADRAAALAAALERVGARLRLTLSQALLDRLPALPATAPALRGVAGRILLDFEIPVSDATIERIHLVAIARDDAQERCDLRVQLALHERDWPDLAQIPVVLTIGDQQWRALTDPWGKVVFSAVAAADLPRVSVTVEV